MKNILVCRSVCQVADQDLDPNLDQTRIRDPNPLAQDPKHQALKTGEKDDFNQGCGSGWILPGSDLRDENCFPIRPS